MRKLLGPEWRRMSLLAVSLLAASPALAQQRAEKPLYRNPAAPLEQRIEDLLARMTQEEKIAQITSIWTQKQQVLDSAGRFDPAAARRLYPSGIGQFARPSDLQGPGNPFKTAYRDVRQTVELVNAIQRHARSTRLGIPVLFHEEGLHGYAARGATHFPQAIALASSWDPALLERVFTVVAREIRARGVQLVLAPVVDVGRDPRWGRIEETYGEDPYLVGELGVAAVQGFQGRSLPLAPDRVLATLKHMTGHGQPESGTNVGPANLSERILREVFFPPFRAAVVRGNAQAVMPSYNEIDGVPSHVNRWLLKDVLRGEMGFKGAVVSDYFAIKELIEVHHTTADPVSAASRALKTGVDSDLPDGGSYALLPRALAQGSVTQTEIDTAVRRMLRLKFLAGLFEDPYADAKRAQALTDNAEARALALEAARKSVVLLKNDGLLPLRADRFKTLAVIGPNAARVDLGGYSNVPTHAVTVLDGIRAKLGERVRVVSAEGVRLTDSGDWYQDEVVLSDPQRNRERIQEAVQVAQGADAIVLVIGGSSATSREAWARSHLGDRADLGLIGEQDQLAQAMFALRKPVVVDPGHRHPGKCVARGLLSRPGRRHGDRGHSVRRCESGRQAAGDNRTLHRAAANVLQPEAERAPRLSLRLRRAVVSIRLWTVVHDLRDRCAAPVRNADRQRGLRHSLGGRAKYRRRCRRRSRAAVRSRRRKLDHAPRQGAQGLSSCDVAGRGGDDRGVHARQGRVRILERGDAVRGRARRVPDHGGAELGGPENCRADRSAGRRVSCSGARSNTATP
jgi:beta-glucosidase